MHSSKQSDSAAPGASLETTPRDFHFEVVVPIDDSSSFNMVASEVARLATHPDNQSLMLIADAWTSMQIDAFNLLRAKATHTYIFGDPPSPQAGSDSLSFCSAAALPVEYEHFLIVMSSSMNQAIMGKPIPRAASSHIANWGFWTAHYPTVVENAAGLLGAAGKQCKLPGLSTHVDNINLALSSAMTIMSIQARQTVIRQRDMAMDKDDLISVLNILKAISAQRRAHDILYVFVERIARVIAMDRCSVLRVWGSDATGHVLASHEDERVQDLVVDLEKYPEIKQSMTARSKVIINDVHHDPLTRKHSPEFRAANIVSLFVVPIGLFDENVGSLFLRAARRSGGFSLREISFCEIVAEAASNALERGHLFESIQKANERLAYLAITDGLTGLYNHRFFRERFEEEFQRTRRYQLPLACMIFDIDNFKKVNDTYGHLQGDKVLQEIAARTLATVRKSDIVARYGGEEFVVIMPQTDPEGAKANAERLLVAIRNFAYTGLPPGQQVTVSIGVAIFEHASMLEPESLIRLADGALYDAKRSGKNRVVVGTTPGVNP